MMLRYPTQPVRGILHAILTLSLLFLQLHGGHSAEAASVAPLLVSGNPDCAALLTGSSEIRIDPPRNGTYSSTSGNASATVASFAGTTFDFSVALQPGNVLKSVA